MAKPNLDTQAQKLKNLMGSARLQTSKPSETSPETEAQNSAEEIKQPEPSRTRAKNLRAIPVSYFDAHAQLKNTNKTSLDFSSYILEALREKLEKDGAIGNQ
ncbi:molecular chaperone GroEL [Kosakonia cowanii]|nr:molecular chaperone GroEL [Kosakonia cowanii]